VRSIAVFVDAARVLPEINSASTGDLPRSVPDSGVAVNLGGPVIGTVVGVAPGGVHVPPSRSASRPVQPHATGSMVLLDRDVSVAPY
jgi:hypothetical protein